MDYFFSLKGAVKEIDEPALIGLLKAKATLCSNMLYRPDALKSPEHPWRFRVNGITFSNVSFKQTTISDFEFANCTFQRCLFISTIFRNCRFTSCRFVGCNPYRAEFDQCFIDPRSFSECIPERRYANIGVYLFQELLRNSRQQAQPDFADEAQYHFRRWQRFQLWQDLRTARFLPSNFGKFCRYLALLVFDLMTGSGMRLGRFSATAFILLLLISALNCHFAGPLGLQHDSKIIGSFFEALYFSAVVMTTVGFGDITPTTQLGQMVVSGQAILGLFLYALLISTIYRKLSS